jgi:hypothetical protein
VNASAAEAVDVEFLEIRGVDKRLSVGGAVCSTISSFSSDQVLISSNLKGRGHAWARNSSCRFAGRNVFQLKLCDGIRLSQINGLHLVEPREIKWDTMLRAMFLLRPA